ncbi:MAG TPA: ELWxxDGT repeat protein [Tepidisphaeraceae bacterium]|nr:ELWxxDGT repeat protein [Tepidisphaeraceae bacterium]
MRRTKSARGLKQVRLKNALRRAARGDYAIDALESRLLLSIVPVANQPLVTDSSLPALFTNLNGTTYFESRRPSVALWKSDGTAGGTALVQPILSGPLTADQIVVSNNTLYVAAAFDADGAELWKIDGASASPVLVMDINPGAAGSAPQNLTDVNGTLFFSADDGTHGRQLWKTDGTSAGTGMVSDINPKGGESPSDLINVNGTLFFSADDGVHGTELWKSDGTSAGTVMVADINPGNASSLPQDLTNVNGTVYFSANDGTHGTELWKSDGTSAGTVMVADLAPAPPDTTGGKNPPADPSSFPIDLYNVNGTLFFIANDGTHGSQLWKSNGTAQGTVSIASMSQAIGTTLPAEATLGGKLYIIASDGSQPWLWTSDGTSAGTKKLANAALGSLEAFNNRVYFVGSDTQSGSELWATDGTVTGTSRFEDLNLGPNGSIPGNSAVVAGRLWFSADDGRDGSEPWSTDGTPGGTSMVADANSAPITLLVGSAFSANGSVYFTANSGLYKVDAAGTVYLGGLDASQFTTVGDRVFFTVDSGSADPQLWSTDGTAVGTVLARDFPLPYPYGASITNLYDFNGELYFSARASSTGDYQVWKSDATLAGTVALQSNSAVAALAPRNFAAVGNTLYFYAFAPNQGTPTLWKTDGTAAGTQNIGLSPSPFTYVNSTAEYVTPVNVNGKLVTLSQVSQNDVELVTGDGTQITHFPTNGIGGFQIDPVDPSRTLAVLNGEAYFFTSASVGPATLCRTDGTAAGASSALSLFQFRVASTA